MLRRLLVSLSLKLFSKRTLKAMHVDLLRWKARLKRGRRIVAPASVRLHIGCGDRRVSGWLNVDMQGSQLDIDLSCGHLPWPDESFEAIVGQHVIEQMDLFAEVLPMLAELRRVSKPGAEIWLSCPDMEKVCRGYLDDRGAALLADRRSRFPQCTLRGAPVQQIVNTLFQQEGEHKNLFDFELLRWALEQAGFGDCQRVAEDDFLACYPEFPRRNDDAQSLHVRAFARSVENTRQPAVPETRMASARQAS